MRNEMRIGTKLTPPFSKVMAYVGGNWYYQKGIAKLVDSFFTQRLPLDIIEIINSYAEAPIILNNLKVDWTQAIFYKTVMSDLSDLADVYYDVLAFFSPTGIKSLVMNFPDFEQKETRIAVFGSTTQKEALEHGLRVDIMAPTPEAPSMTMALDKYISKVNKDK